MEITDDVIDYLLFEARIDLKRATHRVCFLLKCRGESEMAEDTVIRLVEPEPNLDNLIKDKNSLSVFSSNEKEITEEEEIMRLNKGVRKRQDGRYDWRKQVNGINHYLINSNLKELNKEVAEYKQIHFKQPCKPPTQPKKKSKRFIDLAWEWFNLNKKGKITSERQYTARLVNNISKLDKSIDTYTKNDIMEFLNDIKDHRTREYCHIIIKNVFAEAAEAGVTKRNKIATLRNTRGQTEKGQWYTPNEQQKILESLKACKIGKEIEFFLMTGCRLSEAFACKIEYDKLRIWVERTKSNGSSGYVPISQEYANKLQREWDCMFKKPDYYYTDKMKKLLISLGIKRQKNEKPIHRLRHTFATNLYYLGVNDKKRAYLLGHKSAKITNDVYTDFDLDVCKQEILKIYRNLYPKF